MTDTFPLPPLRQELRLEPGTPLPSGAPGYVLFDPLRHLFFQLGALEQRVLAHWRACEAHAVREALVAEGEDAQDAEDAIVAVHDFALANALTLRPPGDAVKDYDVFYFDDADLSWEAEDRAIRAAAALFQDLGVEAELRNQARVHLWYPGRFGAPYPRLRSARDGIDRYLVACTCVGLPADGGAPYLPDSLDDLWHGRLRINPRHPEPRQFAAKADSYRARWDWLSVEG